MGIYNNFVIQKGATWNKVVYWKDSTGTPIDITGYTAKFQIASTYDAVSAALELTTASGITITGAQGKIELLATATQTGALTAGSYHYELELINGSVVTRIMEGDLTVSPQVKS